MHLLIRIPSVVAAAALAAGLAAHHAPVAAQTAPPPTPERTGGDDNAGPPPVTPENGGPPPITPEAAVAYYAIVDGQQQGPMDQAALIALIRSGKLTAGSRIWSKGMADWQNAEDVADIAALIKAHAPPPPPPPETAYFVAAGGQRTGPFTLKQIEEKIAKGEFTDDSQVWQRGMAAWTRAGDVPELAALLEKGPPPKAKDAAPFMIGRWTVGPLQVPAPVQGADPGTLVMKVEYAPNGSFGATITIDYLFGTLKVPLRMEIVTLGTYTAAYKSDDTISVVINGKATKTTYNRSNGKADTPLEESISNSALDWKIIDRNTLDDGAGNHLKRIVE